MSATNTEASPAEHRARMVDRIVAQQPLEPAIENAMRHVERHRYVPDASVADAYEEKAVITHTFADGTHLSCASGPIIVASMLNALDVRPGQRILEIGAGTGYNAALLDTLVGDHGQVVTVDIDADVTTAARRHLDATGFGAVTVLTRDGALGAAEHGPYDRIIVTVGAWDIPTAWWDQLVPGGRLVLPLRWRGTTRAVAFVKQDDHWESDWVYLCGFVPMLDQNGEHSITIDPGGLVSLYYDQDQQIDSGALQDVLERQRAEEWAEATVSGHEPFDRIWLHLIAVDNGTVRLAADKKAIDAGLCTPAIATRTPALIEGDSLAYFTTRRSGTAGRWHLGAIGHGSRGGQLAQRIIDQINEWDRDRTADPELSAYPVGARVPETGGKCRVIVKPDVQLVMSYG